MKCFLIQNLIILSSRSLAMRAILCCALTIDINLIFVLLVAYFLAIVYTTKNIFVYLALVRLFLAMLYSMKISFLFILITTLQMLLITLFYHLITYFL